MSVDQYCAMLEVDKLESESILFQALTQQNSGHFLQSCVQSFILI